MDSLASPNIWAHEPVVMGLVGFGLVSKGWYKGLCYLETAFHRLLDYYNYRPSYPLNSPEILVA